MLKLLRMAIVPMLIAACGPKTAQHATGADPASRWSTALCSDLHTDGHGTAVILHKQGDVWRAEPEDTSVQGGLGREQIRVFPKDRAVCLDAPRPRAHAYGDRCWLRAFSDKSHGDRAHAGYLACNSEFVKCRGSQLDATIVMPLIEFVTFQRICDPVVKHDSLWDAVLSSDALRVGEERHLAEYRRMFAAARSASELKDFMQRYAHDDRDGLLPQAAVRLSAREAEDAARLEQQRAETAQRQQRAEAAAVERLAHFRAALKVGDQTQCGLVIQMKDEGSRRLVEIQLPDRTHWLPLGEILPHDSARCPLVARPERPRVDSEGRPVLVGPILTNEDLIGVHVISDSVGVVQQGPLPMRIVNSTIEAPVCVRTPGHFGLTLENNTLDCGLGVEFSGEALFDNVFIGNRIRGQMSNRDL